MYSFDEIAHIHRFGNRIIPGATTVMKDAGFEYPPGNMELGRAVHAATHYDDEGSLDLATVRDDVYGYLMGWRKFRAETGFKPIRREEANVNAALMLATVLDAEGTWKLTKHRALIEIKKYAPPPFTGLQLALQDLTLPPLVNPRDRVAVELMSDGDYKLHWYKDANDRPLAIALVSLYWYKRNNGLRPKKETANDDNT